MDFNYKTFRDNILKSLSDYKINTLGIKKNGMDTHYKKEYPHILPKDKEIYNLIQSEYSLELWDLIKRYKIKLHKEFHHLNSSQALCFNLFYPIIKENRANLIIGENENIIGWNFEFVPDKLEKTNFDVFIQTDKNNYYFEIKYTEDKFSSKEINEASIKRYQEIYENKLKDFNGLTAEIFLENYQIFRNLSYIGNGIINFIFLKSRIDLDKKIKDIIELNCNKKLQKRIKIIYIEDIVNNALSVKELEEYFNIFSKKYIM